MNIFSLPRKGLSKEWMPLWMKNTGKVTGKQHSYYWLSRKPIGAMVALIKAKSL